MDIFCCTDTNFVIPLGVMLHSICINDNGNELNFHVIIDSTVTEKQKDELRLVVSRKGDVFFYPINIENLKKYLVVKVENFPIPIYYRLLVANILPKSIHKVLYLDADMIIRRDLGELWNISLHEKAVAAVPNQSDCNHYWERLNYDKSIGYFNSGVMLLNLDFIRKHNLTYKFIEFIKNNPEKLFCPDQDVLNYILRNCKLNLPARFNAQEGFYRIPPEKVIGNLNDFYQDISDPLIVHFTKEKPWTKKCKHPLKNVYYYYKSSSPWVDTDYMEHFKYKSVPTSPILKIKILIAKVLDNLKPRKDEKIVYRKINLER